ncbi:ABC transporter substrate-binding protein [Chloroflexota bacterium]
MKKIVWILVSCLMVLSLVMASCGTTDVEEEEEEEVMEEEEEEEEEEDIVSPEAPKYGGVITLIQQRDPMTFDEHTGGVPCLAWTHLQTHQELVQGNWAKGAAGTGESDWMLSAVEKFEFATGGIAESWEIPELGTMIFNIRQGVHYSLDPNNEASRLVGGREVTADDVAWSIEKNCTTPGTYMNATGAGHATVSTLDNWTVEVKLPEHEFSEMWHIMEHNNLYAPEITEEYGDQNDWTRSVGAGPFILTDYIVGSSATLVRNDNYWMTDPVGLGKGNRLPYVDGLKELIIADGSTRLAALRTGKADVLAQMNWEDAESLIKTTPELVYKKYYDTLAYAIGMRQDNPELPFSDVNVRRALMMATDFETIKATWAGGEGQINTWPMPYVREYADCYLSLEEAPASVQELYVYNPDKAMELLDDAGYPTGFATTIICENNPGKVDYLSIIKDMWSKVNIDVTLEPLERGAYNGLTATRNYEEMCQMGPGSIGAYHFAQNIWGDQRFNVSYITDPWIGEKVGEMKALRMMDEPAAEAKHKEIMPYLLDKAYMIPNVVPPQYNMWWPWLKNYDGQYCLGPVNFYTFVKYTWIDQDMKTSMGY